MTSFREGFRRGSAFPKGDFADVLFCIDGDRGCSGDGAAEDGAIAAVVDDNGDDVLRPI